MTFDRPEGASIAIICFPSGGAAIHATDGSVWCGSNEKKGWHHGPEHEPHARYFLTVNEALRFARSCGWVGE